MLSRSARMMQSGSSAWFLCSASLETGGLDCRFGGQEVAAHASATRTADQLPGPPNQTTSSGSPDLRPAAKPAAGKKQTAESQPWP